MPEKTPPQKRTRADAGRIGGLATSRKHGRKHFQKIGRKGGSAERRKEGGDHPLPCETCGKTFSYAHRCPLV